MNKLILGTLLIFLSITTQAGTYIVNDAYVKAVSNTNSNTDSFVAWLEGGTGVCANKPVTFKKSAAISNDVFERAYSASLTAFAGNFKVTVYNYSGSGCEDAAYIKIVRD